MRSIYIKHSIAHDIAIIGAGFLAFELASSLDHPERTIRSGQSDSSASTNLCQRQTVFSMRHRQSALVSQSNGMTKVPLITNHGPVPADIVIVAIGAEPNTELATACGLGTSEGVPTDALMQTTHARVSAIGEVSLHTQPHLDKMMRIESISEANDSASMAAKRLLGAPNPLRQHHGFGPTKAN